MSKYNTNVTGDFIRTLIKKYEASIKEAQRECTLMGYNNEYNEAVANTLNEVIDDLQYLLP